MGADTNIEWTDASWNPVRAKRYDGFDDANDDAFRHGWFCEHVSEGCRNCYAERVNRRLGTDFDFKPGYRGRMKHFLQENLLLAPLKWRKPRRVFLSSMTDIFGDWVSDDMLDRMIAVMALTPQHTYQVLTKRPERAREYLAAISEKHRLRPYDLNLHLGGHGGALGGKFAREAAQNIDTAEWPLPNVWLGTSVEDQAAADERIPHLLATPAAKRFLSCEPLLGAVDLTRVHRGNEIMLDALTGIHGFSLIGLLDPDQTALARIPILPRQLAGIDWVIAGGESGPNARPMHPDWARGLRDQCAAAGVPFFFKQWGEWGRIGDQRPEVDHLPEDADCIVRVGKRSAGRLLDGVEHSGVPA